MDIPGTQQQSGPGQMQAVQRELNDIRELLRSMRLADSPTVKVQQTANGTQLEAVVAPQVGEAEETVEAWRP